jgi:hypothetical protein
MTISESDRICTYYTSLWLILIFLLIALSTYLCGYDSELQPLLFRYNDVPNGIIMAYKNDDDSNYPIVTINYGTIEYPLKCYARVDNYANYPQEANAFILNSTIHVYQLKNSYNDCFFPNQLRTFSVVGIVFFSFASVILVYCCIFAIVDECTKQLPWQEIHDVEQPHPHPQPNNQVHAQSNKKKTPVVNITCFECNQENKIIDKINQRLIETYCVHCLQNQACVILPTCLHINLCSDCVRDKKNIVFEYL